jgi:hypothetical protein
MKKRLRLVLVVLGMITTLEAKRTALREMDDADEMVIEEVTVKTTTYVSQESPKKCKERERKEARSMVEPKDDYVCCLFDVSPDKEDRSKKLYADLAVGFIKYSMPTITMRNAIGGTNTISLEHSSLLPMIRGGMGVEIIGVPCISNGRNKDNVAQTTRVRIGWQALYAKKNAAIETIYTSSSTTAPTLLGLQDVERGEFMAVFSYDLLRDKLSLEGGMGIVGGGLKDFALFQPRVTGSTVALPDFYMGQYLKPRKANFGGFIGVNLAHRFECADRVLLEFGYRCVFSSVKYHTTIYQNQPGSLATAPAQNAFLMAQTVGNAVLPAQPKFKIRANEITFGIVAEF